MSRPWMPFYVGDYLKNTQHLSAEQHGAYLLLILHYWEHGGLPANAKQMQRICRLDADAWDDAKQVLADFFDVDGETWRHARIEAEIEKSATISEIRRDAAAKRHANAGSKAPAKAPANASANAEQMHILLDTQSQSQSHISPNGDIARERAASSAREFDEQFWPLYPNKVGKDAARAAWTKARKKASLESIIDGLRRYRDKTDDRPWCNPATWLNQGRWADEPASAKSQPARPGAGTMPQPLIPVDGIPEDRQRAMARFWSTKRRWDWHHLSPPPDQPGCKIDPAILAEFSTQDGAAA